MLHPETLFPIGLGMSKCYIRKHSVLYWTADGNQGLLKGSGLETPPPVPNTINKTFQEQEK